VEIKNTAINFLFFGAFIMLGIKEMTGLILDM
jgi:hypothetical protein